MISRNNNFGSWLVLGLCLVAVLLWLISPSPITRFSGTNTLVSFGQILGLVGIVLLSVNFILSTRLKILDQIFFGLNNVYQKHSLYGQLGLISLLIHPLFLIPKYATNIAETIQFLWLGSTFAINLGVLALWLMVMLIVLTLYLRPKYHIWKITHKFLGLSLLLGGLHIWLIPSDTADFWPLRLYIIFLVTTALVAFTYRTLLGRWLITKHKYIVSQVIPLSKEIVEVRLKPTNGKSLPFVPGQFVFLGFKSESIGEEVHPFSITSAPMDEELSVTIKKLGDFTNKINQVKPGDEAEIEGPFGVFSQPLNPSNKQIWIAGGVGITPFVSMAKALVESSPEIDLFYSVRTDQEAVYLDLFNKLSTLLPSKFNVFPIYTDKQGYLTAEQVALVTKLNDEEVFICAPPAMINSLKKQFISLGIDSNRIHAEVFDL